MAVDTSKWKKEDLDAISAAGSAWNAATTPEAKEAAHKAAEDIRAKYGVTGGADGSQLKQLPATSTGPSATSGVSQYTALDNSGNNYAQLAGMSELHKAALEAAGNAYNSATTQEQKDAAHQQAEAIRQLYGYSGGVDGSQYIPASGANASTAPTLNDPYQARVDQLLNEIMNRDDFSYDAESDPLYQQYRDQYIREGQRSMQDTLGQVSARTGGLASSYATSAAQQASDYYMSQLADKVPELYQAAYQMYLDDIGLQVQDLGLLQNASDTVYNRYRDDVYDWQDNRDYDRGVLESDRDYDRGVLESDRDFGYMQSQDALAQENWLKEFGLDTSKFNYQKELDELARLAALGDGNGGDPATGDDDEGEPTEKKWSAANNTSLTGGLTGTEYLEKQREEAAKKEAAEADGQVGNKHGDSWVYVTGYNRLTWQELEAKVDSGEIKETLKDGKYYYTKAG